MPRRNKLLETGLIYVILDKETIDKYRLDIFKLTGKLSCTDVDIFQLRFKNGNDRETLELATEIARVIHKRKKIFIVNNRTDIASLAGADGIHLGRNDINTEAARSILGPHKIIGRTIHHLHELKSLNRNNIDYFSVGPVFATKTKPSLKPISKNSLSKIVNSVNKPLFAIGGINLRNLHLLLEKSIKNVSLCRGIILEKDMNKTIKELKKCLVAHS